MVVSRCLGAGNQTLDFPKSSQSPNPLSRLSSPNGFPKQNESGLDTVGEWSALQFWERRWILKQRREELELGKTI